MLWTHVAPVFANKYWWDWWISVILCFFLIKLGLCIQQKDAETSDEKDASEPHTVVAKARSVTQTSSDKKVIIIIS